MNKEKKVFRYAAITAALLFIALCISVFFLQSNAQMSEKTASYVAKLMSDDESEMIDVVTKDGSNFALVFSSDASQSDQAVAADLSSAIRKGCGVNLRYRPDTLAEQDLEILIGNTNRAFSAELLAAIEASVSEGVSMIWGYAYKDGKLAYTATSDEALMYGAADFLALLSEDGTLSIPSDLFFINYITDEAYEEYLREQAAKERQEYIESLIQKNEAFTDEQFNTDEYAGKFYSPMIGGDSAYKEAPYGDPWFYPSQGDHPRYLLNGGILEKIAEVLEEGKDPTSIYYPLVKEFWELADATEKEHFFGEFPSVKDPNGEYYRYDGKILSMIEAKALAYLITGDELYAREAIVCIKNAVLTLNWTKYLHGDTYHGPSNVMVVVAAVYDWCYDMLSEEDKWQLIWGVAQILGPRMESSFRYPPAKFQGVNSHSTGPQILRDWMSISIVVADEAPDWWEFVGGGYFNVYLPIANEMHLSGNAMSGTIIYGQSKAKHQAWAAYLVKTAIGEDVLTGDAKDVERFWLSHLRDGLKTNFEMGDGFAHDQGTPMEFDHWFVFAALYNDPVILANAQYFSDGFTSRVSNNNHTYFSSIQMLCFAAAVDYNGEDRFDGIETIQYFGYPASQMTAREAWNDPDSIAVLMKVGNLTTYDHDVFDHGTFQIYYKGLLAGTSGPYNYGTDAHFYYRKATVAHNGLLVFNPANADAEYTGNNKARYYYSGGQLQKVVETDSLGAWLESGRMADTVGASYGFKSDGGSKYAYLAGDLTEGYDAATIDYVGRKMFTLFTGNEDFPVLFFTFDQIKSDSENFTKHWLLHTLKEPVIDQENLTATVINGDGKMYLESLFGADSIVKIGGEGKAWWINGYFADPNNKGSWNAKTQDFDDPDDKGSWVEGKANNDENAYNGTMNYENIWGRIELRTEGSKYSKFFTVMAITDTANETPFEIEKFTNDDNTVYGAQFENSIVTFLNSEDKPAVKYYKEFTFTTEGKGLYEYYIAGIEAGTWQVLVDGISVAYSLAEEDGALLTFTAPAGEITLKPGKDVIGDNGGKIKYNTGGAIMPSDTPYAYNSEVTTLLPTENIIRGNDTFVGWYTTSDFKPGTEITEIPVGTSGTVNLYAKWFCNFVDEDYTKTGVDLYERGSIVNYIYYNGGGKKQSSFITKTDKNGVGYLEWTEGSMDPILTQTSSTRNFSTLATDDKCVSFTFRFSLDEGKPCMKTYCLIHVKQDVYGASINAVSIKYFNVNDDGRITTANGQHLATLTEDEVTNIRFVVDFKLGEIRYYDDSYNVVAVNSFAPPATTKAENTEELLKCLTEYLWYMRADSPADMVDASLRVYGIRCQEGDEFSSRQTEGIKYNANGGKLPNNAPRSFNEDGSLTPLPLALTRDGYTFAGWYTSPSFEAESYTTYVPEGTKGLYEVYAKWNKIFVDEDYSSSVIDVSQSDYTVNGIIYNGKDKNASSFKTERAADGTTYLVWAVGESDSSLSVKEPLSDVNDNSISYTVELGKNGNAVLPDLEFAISGNSESNIVLGKLTDGAFTLTSSREALFSIGDSTVTLRIVLDFESGTITAYDEYGRVAGSAAFAASAELKDAFTEELFHIKRINGTSDKAAQAVRIYNIKIEEGDVFKPKGNQEIKPNSIIYEANGGELGPDAPTEYDTLTGTLLPTDVTREGYVFGGWFTDAKLKERIIYVPLGTENPVKVYAKWLRIVTNESYDNTNITGSGSANGVAYNNNKNMLYTTVTADGNKYLTVNLNAEPGVNAEGSIAVKDNGNIKDSGESVVSYEMSFSKIPGVDLPPSIKLQLPLINGGSMPAIFNTDNETGKFCLQGSNVVIGEIKEGEFTTLRITVDFSTKTVTAYDENYNAIDSVKVSGLAALEEIDREYHLFLHFRRNQNTYPDMGATGVIFDDLKIVEGMIFEKPVTELPKSNSIIYEVPGGVLPEDAPTEYDPLTGTLLPIPTKSGYIFNGWYTSQDFASESRVYYVPAGTEGALRVYARWIRLVVDENYESVDINASSTSKNNVFYNNSKNMLYTTVSADGNKYLTVNLNADPGVNAEGSIAVKDRGNIKDSGQHVISYEMSFMKMPGVALPPSIKIQVPFVNGGSMPTILHTDSGIGKFTLQGSDVVLGEIKEGEFITLRITVDFITKAVTAYDENYKVIDSVTVSGLPLLEEIDREYHLFLHFRRNQNTYPDMGATGVIIDDLKVAEGMIFEDSQVAPELPSVNTIVYETNGAVLPDGAPTEYDPATDTFLPIPTKNNAIFKGWYTTASFDDGTKVDKISAGTEGLFKVYAKWLRAVVSEDYSSTVINQASGKKNGINYNSTKSMLYQTKDEGGNKYLAVNLNAEPGINAEGSIAVKDSGCFRDSGESVLSYEMSFMKMPDTELPPSIRIQVPFVDGGSMPTILHTDSGAGKFTLQGSDVVIGEIKEGEFTTLRITVDFIGKIVTAYDENHNVIDSVTVSGLPALEEINREYHLFLHFRRSQVTYPDMGATGVIVDDLKVVEGMLFDGTKIEIPKIPENNAIIYETNGATLAKGAPTVYDPSLGTALPAISYDGYIFEGWYTTATFDEGTRIEKIAAGTSGAVTVYARWYRVTVDEDYASTELNAASGKQNGINYNNTKNMLYKTETADGNTYLAVNLNAGAGVNGEGSIAVKDNGYISNSVVCYEMSFMKMKDVLLPTHIRLQLPLTTDGSMPTVFASDDTGAFRLTGSDVVIGTIEEDVFTTLRIAVDFNTKTVTAYDESYAVIDSVVVDALPAFAEIDRQYHMFLHFRKNQNTHPDLAKTGVIVDDIKVVEGMLFDND